MHVAVSFVHAVYHRADPACFEEEQVPHMVSHTLSELGATPD
jgi:hypothetical protein